MEVILTPENEASLRDFVHGIIVDEIEKARRSRGPSSYFFCLLLKYFTLLSVFSFFDNRLGYLSR